MTSGGDLSRPTGGGRPPSEEDSGLPNQGELRRVLDGMAQARSPLLALIAVGRVVQQRLDERLAADGLSVRHAGVLGHLAADPGLSFSELARRAGVTVQTMHVLVGRMAELGLVVGDPGAQPGQPAALRLTHAGLAGLRRAAAAAAEVERELLSGWPPGDRQALLEGLERLAGAARPPGAR